MRKWTFLCAFIWGIGCAEGEHPPIASHDSAGVRVIVSQPPPTPRRGVLGQPVFSIGSAAGVDAYLFHRVAGGLLLDGKIAVADGGALEIRFYDTMGIHQKTIGGLGEGPGEFRDLGWIGRYRGDSIMVFDRALQRATVFDEFGELGRADRLASNPIGAPVRYVSAAADGSLFGRGTVPAAGPTLLRGMWRDTLALIRYWADGSHPQLIAKLPGDDRYALSSSGGAQQINNHPLGRIPAVIAAGNVLLYADGSATSVDVLSFEGEVTQRFRLVTEPRPVSDEAIALVKSRFLGDDPEPGWTQEVERLFSSIQWPKSVPGSAALFSDPAGDVWLQVFDLDAGAAGNWIRFRATGGYLYTLETPPRFTPLDFGDRFVLGMEVDDLGVERVTLRPIQVPEG